MRVFIGNKLTLWALKCKLRNHYNGIEELAADQLRSILELMPDGLRTKYALKPVHKTVKYRRF